MKYLKTYQQVNELFGLFKKKKSEEDEIIIQYINRLKRINGKSPYSIEYSEGDPINPPSGSAKYFKYRIEFGDTPISISKVKIVDNRFNRFTPKLKTEFIKKGGVFKTEKELYTLYLSYPVDDDLVGDVNLMEELFDIAEKVYKEDKRLTKLQKIKDEINPAADLLDPDIY